MDLDTADIAARSSAAIRLGWAVSQLRGVYDPDALPMSPGPVQFPMDALRVGRERKLHERRQEVWEILTTTAAAALGEPDWDVNQIHSSKYPDASLMAEVAAMEAHSKRHPPEPWTEFGEFSAVLDKVDATLQNRLLAISATLVAAYRAGRIFADTRWALHPDSDDQSTPGGRSPIVAGSWLHVFGEERRSAARRQIQGLPACVPSDVGAALIGSLNAWGEVAGDPAWRKLALGDELGAKGTANSRYLDDQVAIWHDLLLGELSADTLIDSESGRLLARPYRILPVLSKFPIETILVVLGLVALGIAGWFYQANLSRPTRAISGAAEAAQAAGGQTGVSAIFAGLGALGLTSAALLAKLRTSAHSLVARLQQALHVQLLIDAATVLPPRSQALGRDTRNVIAGPGIRLVAVGVDLALLGALLVTALAAIGFADLAGRPALEGLGLAILFALPLLYFPVAWKMIGKSAGMAFFGLSIRPRPSKVLSAQTPPRHASLGWARAFLRFVGFVLAVAPVAPLGLMVFTRDHRGLEDLIAGTIVVRKVA